MKIRLLLAIIASIFMFSGVASAQTQRTSYTVDNSKICGIPANKLLSDYKVELKREGYGYSEIVSKINEGIFDNNTDPKELKDPRKMCLLLFMLSNSKADTTDAETLSETIVNRYEPYKGHTLAADVKLFVKALASGRRDVKISKLMNSFYKNTAKIWTTKLKERYAEEGIEGLSNEEARNTLINEITKYDISTVEKIIEHAGLKSEEISKEVIALLDKKEENFKKLNSGAKNCEELLKEFQKIMWGQTISVVEPEDGVIDSSINVLTPGKFSRASYVLESRELKGGDIVGGSLSNSPDYVLAKNKVVELEKAIKAFKCVNTPDYGDINGIAALYDGWFENWRECEYVTGVELDTCKQKILEATYNMQQAALWGLVENNDVFTLTNHVVPDTLINQLETYFGAKIVVKNAGKIIKQNEIDLESTCPKAAKENGTMTSTCAPLWQTQDKANGLLSSADTYINDMTNYLLHGFSTEEVKNICFGFQVNTANSALANALKADVPDLSVSLSLDKTIDLFKKVTTHNTSRIKTIQEACVFFNRIKKAEISGNEKDFATKLVKLFGLDPEKAKYIICDDSSSKEDVVILSIADALVANDNVKALHWLNYLKGVRVYDQNYYLDIQNGKKDYNRNSAIRDGIIEASGVDSNAGNNSKITGTADKDKKDNKGNKDNKDNKGSKTASSGTSTDVSPSQAGKTASNGDLSGLIDSYSKLNKSKGKKLHAKINPNDKGQLKKFHDRPAFYKELDTYDAEQSAWIQFESIVESYLKGSDDDFQKAIDLVQNTASLQNVAKIDAIILAKICDLSSVAASDCNDVYSLMSKIKINETDMIVDEGCFDESLKVFPNLTATFERTGDNFKILVRAYLLSSILTELYEKQQTQGRIPGVVTKEKFETYKNALHPASSAKTAGQDNTAATDLRGTKK